MGGEHYHHTAPPNLFDDRYEILISGNEDGDVIDAGKRTYNHVDGQQRIDAFLSARAFSALPANDAEPAFRIVKGSGLGTASRQGASDSADAHPLLRR